MLRSFESAWCKCFVNACKGYSRKKYLGGEDGRRYIFLWAVGAESFQIIWVIGVGPNLNAWVVGFSPNLISSISSSFYGLQGLHN